MCLLRNASRGLKIEKASPIYERFSGSPPARLRKAERESLALIVSLGFNCPALLVRPQHIDQPLFLFRAFAILQC